MGLWPESEGAMGAIVDLIGAAAGGGIFGLIGSIFGWWATRDAIAQERAFEKDKWSYEQENMRLQMAARAAETEQELAIVSQEGSWTGLETSVQHDEAAGARASGWVNDVRSLFRPVLTLTLQGLQAWVIWLIASANVAMIEILANPSTPGADILRYAVYSLVFAAQTSVVWWFGDRALTPPKLKNR
jgi:hypothetical protein